jgi:hypothetical protein
MSAPATNTTTPDKKEQKGLLKKYLDNTFGDEGLRTDVKITLTNETIIKVVVMVVAASVLGTAAHIVVKKMFT